MKMAIMKFYKQDYEASRIFQTSRKRASERAFLAPEKFGITHKQDRQLAAGQLSILFIKFHYRQSLQDKSDILLKDFWIQGAKLE
jgi:hypothetical protein